MRIIKQHCPTDCLGIMRNNKNLKWFFLGWFVVMIFLALWTFPEHKPLRSIDLHPFHVQENEEIYFKNIRSFYYDFEHREDANFHIYRLKERAKDSLHPTLQFAIVNNWRNDEAYILTELPCINCAKGGLIFPTATTVDTLFPQLFNAEQHWELAVKTYEQLTQDQPILLLTQEKQTAVQLFTNEEERLQTLRVLKDYFKLTSRL